MIETLLQKKREEINSDLDRIFNKKNIVYSYDENSWYVRDGDLIKKLLLDERTTKKRFKLHTDMFNGFLEKEIECLNKSVSSSLIFNDDNENKAFWAKTLSELEKNIDVDFIEKYLPDDLNVDIVEKSTQPLNNKIFELILEKFIDIDVYSLLYKYVLSYARFLDGFLDEEEEFKNFIINYNLAIETIKKNLKIFPENYNSIDRFISDFLIVLTASLNSTSDLICECIIDHKSKFKGDDVLLSVLIKKPPITLIGRVAMTDIEIDSKTIKKGDKIFFLTGYSKIDEKNNKNADIIAYGIGNGKCSGYRIANLVSQLYIKRFHNKFPENTKIIGEIEYEIGFSARSVRKLRFKEME